MHKFTVTDDISLSYFGDRDTRQADPVTFSPDGRYFVVDTERGLLDVNRPESTLRFFRTEAIRQFLLHPEDTGEPAPFWIIRESTYKDGPIITQIRWLTDSSGVAFLVKTGTGGDQLRLAELKTKTVRPLTPIDQAVKGFSVRSRKTTVYTVQGPLAPESTESLGISTVGTGRSLYSLLFRTPIHGPSELWAFVNGRRFRLKDKTGRSLSVVGEGEHLLAISPDGHWLLTALPVESVPTEWEKTFPPPVTDYPYRIKAGRQDLTTARGPYYLNEYALVDLVKKDVKLLTSAPIGNAAGWWGDASADWSSDSKEVVISNTFVARDLAPSGQAEGRPCVAVVDVEPRSVTCVEFIKRMGYDLDFHYVEHARFVSGSNANLTIDYSIPNGSKGATLYSRSDRRSWINKGLKAEPLERSIDISVKESLNEAPLLFATDTTTKTSRMFFDPNPQLKDVQLGDAQVYKWRDEAGREWIGGLYKPPDYVDGHRYPLVIQTHGFAQDEFRPDGYLPSAFAARELAAAGIVVLQVNDCAASVSPEEARCNLNGYEAAIKQLSSAGVVDEGRVGIVGFSRTCYYVLQALTTSKVHFKAASITDGPTYGYFEYVQLVDADNNLFVHDANAVIGAAPFGDGLQTWLRQSPDFNMHSVATPLQIVTIGSDSSLLNMWGPYAALRSLKKPVDLIVLGEGTHVLTNPAQRMVSQGGTVDWFRFWLKGEQDPSTAKASQYARWRCLQQLQTKE